MKDLILICVLLLLTPALWAFDYCTPPSLDTHNSIVKITGQSAVGSGVVIDRDRVLTAAHVLEGMRDIKVTIHGKALQAVMIATDHTQDLALLYVPTDNIQPIPLRRTALAKEASVWSMGYAFGRSLATGRGRYKKLYKGMLYTTAPVNFGQSGGGLISCENGRHVLAGIIRAFGAQMQNGELVRRDDISVAARPKAIRRFVTSSLQLAQNGWKH